MMNLSLSFVVVFILSPVVILIYSKKLFEKSQLLLVTEWSRNLFWVWMLNLVSFTLLAIYFQKRYGFITDDVNYFYGADGFPDKHLWELKSGSEFMFYMVAPIKHLLGLDRYSFHIIFATLGFLGSLNLFSILIKRIDFKDVTTYKINRLGLFALTCFPNLMFWGRVFGKDSTMFVLASVMTIGAYTLLMKKEINVIHVFTVVASLYVMQIIRPHVAGVLGLAFGVAYMIKIFKIKSRNVGFLALVKFYLPIALVSIMFIFIIGSIRRLGISDEKISTDALQEKLISATYMGSYGGSATELASEIKENPRIIFDPLQIIKNIGNLFFAPLPWQIRGGADIIAFLSNIILFYLLYKYGRKIKIFDVAQVFFLSATIGLTLLLSFMTGNIGLILRQKTIILPFLFLLIFSRPPEELQEEEMEEGTV